jgi:hypothetical protein
MLLQNQNTSLTEFSMLLDYFQNGELANYYVLRSVIKTNCLTLKQKATWRYFSFSEADDTEEQQLSLITIVEMI